jgi:hypothetical protein
MGLKGGRLTTPGAWFRENGFVFFFFLGGFALQIPPKKRKKHTLLGCFIPLRRDETALFHSLHPLDQ